MFCWRLKVICTLHRKPRRLVNVHVHVATICLWIFKLLLFIIQLCSSCDHQRKHQSYEKENDTTMDYSLIVQQLRYCLYYSCYNSLIYTIYLIGLERRRGEVLYQKLQWQHYSLCSYYQLTLLFRWAQMCSTMYRMCLLPMLTPDYLLLSGLPCWTLVQTLS